MPFVPGIKRLSQLTIDTAKNWAAQKIANLGAPTVAGDSLRKGSAEITDTEIAAANKDGAAGTASMRTLGAGAQQAAAGSHTHTLTDDVLGEGKSGNGPSQVTESHGISYRYFASDSEVTLATVTPTFAAGSRAVGVAVAKGSAVGPAPWGELRLYMGGVLVASTSIPNGDGLNTAKGTRALSGAQACEARLFGNATAYWCGLGWSAPNAHEGVGVIVGSIKS